MRYIWGIITFLLAVSIVFSYLYFSSDEKPVNALVTINKRVISRDEFDRHNSKVYAHDDREMMNNLVTKELLIQEAQRMSIDKTDVFRKSIQDFYEQTLVKQVIDKKNQDIHISISDEDIERYRTFQEQTLYLSFFDAKNEEDATKGRLRRVEDKKIQGKDLSEVIAQQVQSLKPGGITAPIGLGSNFIVIRLDKVENGTITALTPIARESIRKMLVEQKKRFIVDAWITDLRKMAVIRGSL